MATPAGFEPATFSLEGVEKSNAFQAHADKQAGFGAIDPAALVGFVGRRV